MIPLLICHLRFVLFVLWFDRLKRVNDYIPSRIQRSADV